MSETGGIQALTPIGIQALTLIGIQALTLVQATDFAISRAYETFSEILLELP